MYTIAYTPNIHAKLKEKIIQFLLEHHANLHALAAGFVNSNNVEAAQSLRIINQVIEA